MPFYVLAKRNADDTGKLIPYSSLGANGANRPANPSMTGLLGWYDADSEFVTKDGSNYVSAWADKSGQGNHLSQGTGANQPLWVASGQNSRPLVRFNGVAHVMQSESFTQAQPITVYFAMKQVSWNYGDGWFGDVSAGFTISQNDTTPKFLLYAGSDGPRNEHLEVGSFNIAACVVNGASTASYVKGQDAHESATGTDGITGGFYLGAFYAGYWRYAEVDVAECLVYGVAHTGTQVVNMMNWLGSKYGV